MNWIQTTDGKYHKIKFDTGGWYFYYQFEKHYVELALKYDQRIIRDYAYLQF